MPGLKIICPSCEEDVEITEREQKMAVMFKSHSEGIPMTSCPKCCRVLKITGAGLPENIEEWNPNVDDMFCVPLLDDTVARIPAGYVAEGGHIKYRPGSGGPLLAKRDYMYMYGYNPECYLKL